MTFSLWHFWSDSSERELNLSASQWSKVHTLAQRNAPKAAGIAITASIILANVYLFWPEILNQPLPPLASWIHFTTYFILDLAVYRAFYVAKMRRPIRAAINTLGYAHICEGCGYRLANLPTGTRVCPECGEEITHLPAAETSHTPP